MLFSDICFIFLIYIIYKIYSDYKTAKKNYEETDYYKQTKTSMGDLFLDEGKIGEYNISRELKGLEGYKKFLFNVYINRPNRGSTEIDTILIHSSGIYVFESKNYGGWIYGNESNKYWKHVFGRDKKYNFLNPTIQNNIHINGLRFFLDDDRIPIYSYIVFGNRCELKRIFVNNDVHKVLKRYDVYKSVNDNYIEKGVLLSVEQIDELYIKLYPLTQVSEEVKLEHINQIKNKYR